ncbi:MAG: CocE/NonD family hydrolase [Gemmatimonadota bacterium]|nr:CocE/NonD family hydrolase [Gemmatimonadota bacterium]
MLLYALTVPIPLAGQQPADPWPGFESRMEMIPMRDGARLHTFVYRPSGADQALPILMLRTPYGIVGRAKNYFPSYMKELVADGYIIVFQDIRGRYDSEGEFVMNRPLHDPADPKGVDESTDTWDTVEWLVTNLGGHNGRVGVLGISYPGWLAAMAGINPHPAVKAISPQAPMTDTWMGDDFFHQGTFRLSYGFEYSADMELSNDGSVPLPIDRHDTYDWYLAQGPLSSLTALLGGRVPTWTSFTRHPAYDAFWQARALPLQLTRLSVPTLTVGGWWDQEDLYGPIATYAALERHDAAGINFFVMGPWNHGGWARAGDSLGSIAFGGRTGDQFRAEMQARWFAWWLKDQGTPYQAEARVFDAGVNQWVTFDQWPPLKQTTTRKLYLRGDGRLGWEPPTETRGSDNYVSDPAHPVPYRERPIETTYNPRGSRWGSWMTEDQRQVHNRPDVLSWETEPLTEDITIAGDILARLFASTTGRDADWVVKLIDVYPDSSAELAPRMGGFQLMVAGDVLRGRYRESFSHPTPLVPNKVARFTVDLHQQAYTFRKGHRIMVQVQSSWFPVYDQNPQTWVPNIFEAKPADFRAQTHRIERNSGHPSHLELPVLTR